MAREPEMIENELSRLARGLVERAEHSVDVERELAAFHARRAVSATPTPGSTRPRWPLLAVAALALVIVGLGAVLARSGDDEIVVVPGMTTPPSPTVPPTIATTAPVTKPGADPTAPPLTGQPTAPAASPAVSTAPTQPAAPEFTFIEPVDGTVRISGDAVLAAASFEPRRSIPVSDEQGAQWRRLTATMFVSFELATGEVTVYDVETGLIGATALPVEPITAELRDVAIGPENVVYGLYAHGLEPVTVTASPLEPCPAGSTCTIATWAGDTSCESEGCFLEPTDDGFTWVGGTVPYVDEDGVQIAWPDRVVDPLFTADYSTGPETVIPDRVDVTGPNGATHWHLRIDGIAFDDSLGRRFAMQPDGSFITEVVLRAGEEEEGATIRRTLLWLVPGGRVATIDFDSVPGLLTAVATADGRLLGIVREGPGVLSVGDLSPMSP